LLFFCTFSSTHAAGGGLSRHDESGKIVKLLETILKKFGKGRTENKAYLSKIEGDLSSAEVAVKSARKTYKKEFSEATHSQENAESEERLIRKILAMLKSDVGEHANHVAMSCDEVMLDRTNSDGYYYVNVDGDAKKVYCARQEGRVVFSGSCNHASKGNGWAKNCLNNVEFNYAKQYLTSKSDGTITIEKAGVYRVVGSANMYSESKKSHHGRILVNGKTRQYSYHNAKQNTADFVKMYIPLKKGEKITVVWYINSGSKSERYAASDSDGGNRVQVDFIGLFDDLALFSGGCEGHRKKSSWASNCIASRDWNPAGIQEKTFTVESNGNVIAKVSGFYHIQATNLLHATNAYTRAEVKIAGKRRQYLYTWDLNWRQMHVDLTYWVKAGQRIDIRWKADGGNPYGRHSKSKANGYNRMQVLFLGGEEMKPYQFMGGCTKHSRSKSWATYCLNQSWRNDLKKELSIAGSGVVTVKKSGFYRIAAHANVHRKRWENAFSRILVDEKTVDSSTVYGKNAWTEIYHDIILPLNKGQKFQIQYMASNYAYHSWSTHSSVQIMYVDRK